MPAAAAPGFRPFRAGACRAGDGETCSGTWFPLAGVLADMEAVGFEADGTGIADFGPVLEDRITAIQQQITEAVGYAFNLNSRNSWRWRCSRISACRLRKKPKPAIPPARTCSKPAECPSGGGDAARLPHLVQAQVHLLRRPAHRSSARTGGSTSFNQTETRTGRNLLH